MKNETIVQSHDASLKNLENQIGQLATAVSNRPQGNLVSNIENQEEKGKSTTKWLTWDLERMLIVHLVYQKEELSPTKAKNTLK